MSSLKPSRIQNNCSKILFTISCTIDFSASYTLVIDIMETFGGYTIIFHTIMEIHGGPDFNYITLDSIKT